jgi:hypothetical protein
MPYPFLPDDVKAALVVMGNSIALDIPPVRVAAAFAILRPRVGI